MVKIFSLLGKIPVSQDRDLEQIGILQINDTERRSEDRWHEG